jgi:hypothetical protein
MKSFREYDTTSEFSPPSPEQIKAPEECMEPVSIGRLAVPQYLRNPPETGPVDDYGVTELLTTHPKFIETPQYESEITRIAEQTGSTRIILPDKEAFRTALGYIAHELGRTEEEIGMDYFIQHEGDHEDAMHAAAEAVDAAALVIRYGIDLTITEAGKQAAGTLEGNCYHYAPLRSEQPMPPPAAGLIRVYPEVPTDQDIAGLQKFGYTTANEVLDDIIRYNATADKRLPLPRWAQ